jgi:CHAT domain-containing protein
MLVYCVGDSGSSLWVVTDSGWDHVRIPGRADLASRCSVLRSALARTGELSLAGRRAARSLYQDVVLAAEPLLRDRRHLIVAPDGPLAFVPFEALLAIEVDDAGEIPGKAYLLDRYDVTYTQSVAALAAGRQARPGSGGVVALGDPLFATTERHRSLRTDLAPLPHTAGELASVQLVADEREIDVLVGAEATRSHLLSARGLADAQVIHLATHGIAEERDASRSGLWLGVEGDGQPGFLNVPDIVGLDLRATVVSLTACETGLGRIERGEGALSLPRAFMTAGANSVLVSLWKVNDQSTARLIERFYRGLLKRKGAGSVALAEAKREMLKKKETRSPFLWASFVLVGPDRTTR